MCVPRRGVVAVETVLSRRIDIVWISLVETVQFLSGFLTKIPLENLKGF